MSRITERFDLLKETGQKALVTFVTAGDPDLEATKQIFEVVEKGGADIVELGVPFSDPLADGPVIQASSQRSLKSGTTLKKIVALVSDIRKTSNLPIVLMSSYNPIFVYGQETFARDAVKAGVDGVIVPDLPPEEADEFSKIADREGLDMIFLLAPTSTEDRVRIVSDMSRGFIYYVSLTGTTGMKNSLAGGIRKKTAFIKERTQLPLLIGFGISGPQQAKEAADMADGVIVGSAIVKLIEQNSSPEIRRQKVGAFVADLKKAITNSS